MARSRAIEAPARNDVYFGMWAVTLGAVVVALVLLCLELTDYGWTSTPPAASAPNLPNVPTRVAPTPGTTAMLEPEPTPAPKTPKLAEAPKVEPTPAEPVKLPPAPIPPSVTATAKPPETIPTRPATEPTKPAVPAGPVPGFELPRRR